MKRSLMLRLGLAFTLIAVLALFGIISSVIIAETLRGEATAINRAGALRMQTYIISTELLEPRAETSDARRARVESALDRFDSRYRSEALTRIVPRRQTEPARQAYDEVGRVWHQAIRPGILAAVDGPLIPEEVADLREQVDAFVGQIDELVRLLEQKTESKVQLLRFTQGLSLFLTLVVIFITMYFVRTEVLQPLRELLRAAEAVRRRDFGWRTLHTGDDELGRLGTTFNLMAEDLSQTYEELEARVREKTGALERSNRSLALMYRSLMHLQDAHPADASYSRTLRELERFLGLGAGSVCVVEPDGRKGFRMATSESSAGRPEVFCTLESCRDCLEDGRTRLNRPARSQAENGRVLTVPLRDGERTHGLLRMQVPDGITLEPWQIQLAEGVAQHLGTAIGRQLRADQLNRLALLEERATIARELHDSLAQALTYMKIQVSRLQGMLKTPGREFQMESTLRDLREGLNSAYGELRELLTTFRIRMDEQGLNRALEATVREFADRGELSIRLDNRVADGQIGVNEEIHVLQIVREALSNVIKHSGARSATVGLETATDGRIRVTLEDDGRGMPQPAGRRGHYGLAIMRERARNLNGEFDILPRADGGTIVTVLFEPAALPAAYTEPLHETTTDDATALPKAQSQT
ncbi:histidine kinase [Thioalkalivibrio nitratireducens]|nr:type IV pili methyl-accepting chemotaxis transducer N-terminal domain-containing protein [Thioalkalivibrio nitratireducens]